MNPADMNLPSYESIFTPHVSLHPEWVVDPPPWIMEKLRPEVVQQIYAVKLRHLAQCAKIETQMAELKANMYNEQAEVLARAK